MYKRYFCNWPAFILSIAGQYKNYLLLTFHFWVNTKKEKERPRNGNVNISKIFSFSIFNLTRLKIRE